jgi:DNA repair exonuclease SbcCD ATPase subunit
MTSDAQKPAADAPPAIDPNAAAATDEDILRLRSRLDRELAMVTQKLTDAEESIIDMEVAVRAAETGSRPHLPAAASSGEKGTERITARIRAVGSGLNKIRDWVVKPKEGDAGGTDSGAKPHSEDGGDLEDRLEEALRTINLEIRDRERDATELDRKLHEAQKELIRHRAQEQHVREMQLRVGQTKQLSEDLERKMAMLDDMVRTYESSTKSDTGIRSKPKEQGPALPKFEDRLQSAIDEALKGVAAQEKKVTEIEAQLGKANAALVAERTRQQRVRSMQMRLRQSRHFSTDLHRALSSMAASIEDLRVRAGNLLKPEARAAREKLRKPVTSATPVPVATPPNKATTS